MKPGIIWQRYRARLSKGMGGLHGNLWADRGYSQRFRGNPLDKVEVVAKPGVPIIVVAGDADAAVPFLENSAIFEKKYTEYGGI